MKLQRESVEINSGEFSDTTGVSNYVLRINRRELRKLLEEDEHFASVNIELAKPGDPTRIVNVVDVAEPRCKISGGVDFPGVRRKLSQRAEE